MADAGPYARRTGDQGDHRPLLPAGHQNKPVSVAGYEAVAILAAGGKSQRIVLEPMGDSRLSGTSEQPLGSNAKGVIKLTGPDGKTTQGIY